MNPDRFGHDRRFGRRLISGVRRDEELTWGLYSDRLTREI